MAGLQEQARWESEVYRIEENDPVHGGENGITNKPTKQLANRTKYLKQELDKRASTAQVGRTQLTNDTGLDSETLALTAKAGKALAQRTAQNQQAIAGLNSGKVDKTAISNAVNSTSQTNVASSQAVKTAYDKGAEAKNAADAAQRTANAKWTAQDATTARKGITQLTNDTGLESETLALTAKAGKAISQRIAQNQQAIAGLNSGKVDKTAISNSVSSTSQTNVASSQAVNTAYNKGVEAKNAADAAQRTANNANTNANGRVSKSGDTMTGHLQIKDGDWSSVRLFNRQQKMLILEVQPDTQGGFFGALIYRDAQERNLANLSLPQKNGALALVSETVSKAGDTMTGILEIDRADSFVRGKQGGTNKWFVGKGSGSSDDVALHNYAYNYGVILKSDRVETAKPLYVGANRVPHAGDAYMDLTSSNYGGIAIHRPDRNDNMIMESHGDGFAFIRRNRANQQNNYAVHMPAKSGTLLLEGDLGTKTKSLVSRRDYSRRINGTHTNHRNQQITISGSVHIYPDGRIVQIFNLQNMSFDWFNRDGDHSQARAIPLQLWTAMPNAILDVNAKPLRAITQNSTEYGLEAGEWVTGWSLYRQGAHKDRVQIDCNRLEGSGGELVNLYVVVEGY